MYNIYLPYYVDRDVIQTLFPLDQVGLIDEHHVQEYRLTTWTSAVAFTAFVLASARPKLHDPFAFLDAMLPNNMVVWKAWKEAMATVLKDREYVTGDSGEHSTGPEDVVPPVLFSDADLKRVDKEYQGLLRIFFRDADDAWRAWCKVRNSRQMISLRERKCEIAT